VVNDIGHDATKISYGSGIPRWRKCGAIAKKIVVDLDITLQKFNDEDKRNIVRKIMEHEIVRAFLPKHISFSKGLEKKLQALGNMREAYATLTFAR
jgi:hypothetical protein